MTKISSVDHVVPTRRGFLWKLLTGGAIAAVGGTGVMNHVENLKQADAIAAVGRTGVMNHVENLKQADAISRQAGELNRLNDSLNAKVTLDQIVRVVRNVTPSAVKVGGPFGHGSGIIIATDKGRFILTNSHVTTGNSFEDGTYEISLYNGSDFAPPTTFRASLVTLGSGGIMGSPPERHDFSLLHIPPDVQLPDRVGMVMRDLKKTPVSVGEAVIAVGNPFGERDTVTSGIISHIDRGSALNINHHFQTDAPINPGNSGGGLFDLQGRLLGINTWGYMGADGIGGAIRIDEISKKLKEKGINLQTG